MANSTSPQPAVEQGGDGEHGVVLVTSGVVVPSLLVPEPFVLTSAESGHLLALLGVCVWGGGR